MGKEGTFMCPNPWGRWSEVEGSVYPLFKVKIPFVGETGPDISSPADKGSRGCFLLQVTLRVGIKVGLGHKPPTGFFMSFQTYFLSLKPSNWFLDIHKSE